MSPLIRWGRPLVVAAVIGLAWGSTAWPYEMERMANGGTITGRVLLRGPIPAPRTFPMVIYAFGNFCKKISNGEGLVLLREFNVDGAGGLQDAVVSIQNVERGKPFRSRQTDLVTVNCMFHPAEVPEDEQFDRRDDHLVHIHPLVTVMRNHALLSVINRDPIAHAAQVYQPEKGNRIVSFPIPVSYRERSGYVEFEEGKHVAQIICELHEYMQTWAWVVDNPYFEKTRAGGEFSIGDVPPGSYIVTAWHPHMKPIEHRVTIPPGGTVTIDFEFDARTVVRPIYETQEQFRISPERDPTVNLHGCEGPFCVREEHAHH
jgi:hypothetical protein